MRSLVLLLGWWLWSLPAQGQLLSPGALSAAHRALDSDRKCTECHASGGGGGGVMDNRCTTCHDAIADQRQQRSGLHGRVFDDNCGQCHVEHRGRSYDLIRWPSGSAQTFDHKLTGFSLSGAHGKLTCNECHRNAQGTQPDTPRYLGLDSTCASCHADDDPHEGRFGERCNQCHGTTSWADPKLEEVDHSRTRFPLRGAHVRARCDSCHGNPPVYRGLDFSSCQDCHRDPHEQRLGRDCRRCHQESRWDALTMARGDHPALAITAGHAPVECQACHDRGTLKAPSQGKRCVDCHAPVHDADFGQKCETCHGPIRWLQLPDWVGENAHQLTAFALEGAHSRVACTECHAPEQPQAQRYRGLEFEQCGDCHADPHAGLLTSLGGGDCAGCHKVEGFRPTAFGIAQHARTDFELVGRHMAVPCFGCHKGESPRFDWRITRDACADCHENPHGDQFASEMRQGGCAHCHSPVAWDAPNIDHSTWPLTGAHALAACAACHGQVTATAAGTGGTVAASRAQYAGIPRECQGCHEDVHRGQFQLSAPQRGCQDCHQTTTFSQESFDHAGLANYPLEGKHGVLECDACHAETRLHNGEQVVRFRLGYRTCAACHSNPHTRPGSKPQEQQP